MYSKVLFLLFISRSPSVLSEEFHKTCRHTTCHDCITDPVQCVWCSAELDNLSSDKRCKPANSYNDDWCPVEYIENAKSDVSVIADREFASTKEDVVQLRPQSMKVKLRVGEKVEYNFRYKATADYPVDLYFLLDASESMMSIRDDIMNRSEAIYNTIYNLTNNVYLGLGTFIDKNLIPFNDDPANKLCYSFKHSLNLTDNLEEFRKNLQEIRFGTNYDHPEGGFDGLAQIMACKKMIAWRPQTRKVIIYLTDNLVHSAGDGQLAGIFRPYDGQCYLDSDGSYYKEKEMDYPSVGMISKLAADDQFSILFEVPTKYAPQYKVLSNAIFGAIGSTNNNQTISERLGDFYKNISFNLQLDVNIPSKDKEHFEITFNPDCTKKMSCKIEIGEEMHITSTIKLREYYGKNNVQIPIVQKGLEEKLVLDVEVISTCDCEHESASIPLHQKCNNAGKRQCGICNCNEGRSGSTCMCEEHRGFFDNTTSCMENGVECSGNGLCSCGDCSCNTGFEGQFCQFRNDNCKRTNGVLCSGHGKCLDGECQCHNLWKGDACDCSMASFYCRDAEGIECNNHGHCECGRCKCSKLPKWDVRDYRDEYCSQWPCEDCHERQCRQLIDCVSCINSSSSCIEECGDRIVLRNVTEDLNSHWNVCTNVRISFGCYSNFSYAYDEETRGIILYANTEPNCIASHYAYGGIVLGSLILIGIASLLAWKLLNDSRDRAEFERFLQRAREVDEELVNECYSPPTTTFKNPMFRKLSFRT